MAISEDDLISLSFQSAAVLIAGLPLSGFVLCIFFSLILHYEQTTRTHCGVDNWLPSVSAAVSSYSPEIYIWRVFIAIHGGPRLALAIAYRNFLLSSPLRPLTNVSLFRIICQLGCVINLAENLFLLGLTSISSRENHEAHKVCFVGFVISSLLYMCLATWLFSLSGRRRTTSLGESSYEYKILASAVAIISMTIASYLYWRHNAYCEPGVYTIFALAEYSFVLSNIAFHFTLYYDFQGTMVYFVCGRCNDSLKKQQVQTHEYKCHSNQYSCVDCQAVFNAKSYDEHRKCITENEKYGGKNFVAKVNKGEAKQNEWTDQVERAISAVTEPGLKDLLQRITGFSNIPRKEAKFINFLMNSIRIHNRSLCERAWAAISEEASKIQKEQALAKQQRDAAVDAQKKEAEASEIAKSEAVKEEDGVQRNGSSGKSIPSLKWRASIKRKLGEAGGEMQVKKLKKAMLGEFIAAGGEKKDFEDVFLYKLGKSGVDIKDEAVRLCAAK
ncbi:unnamed protein product, partial [Mesorhabditis spiculigera]